jgi:polyferredoxin
MKIYGRAFCGRICPFGILQDLVNKIPFPKKIRTFKTDKYLRYIKYVVLVVWLLDFIIPEFDMALSPIASITIVAIIALAFILLQRPICKYICPAGAVFSILNKTTRHKYNVDMGKCSKCRLCEKSCKIDIIPYSSPNSLECIHCDICVKVCPRKAITIVDTTGFTKGTD